MKKNCFKFASYFILLFFALTLLFQKPIRIAVADVVYDNKIHLTACKDLPTFEEVKKVLEENSAFVRKIEEVMPGHITVEVGMVDDCPEKADIMILFGGHSQREEIERMIGGDLLFGIPYRMRNT